MICRLVLNVHWPVASVASPNTCFTFLNKTSLRPHKHFFVAFACTCSHIAGHRPALGDFFLHDQYKDKIDFKSILLFEGFKLL